MNLKSKLYNFLFYLTIYHVSFYLLFILAKEPSLESPKEKPRTEQKESVVQIEEVSTPNRANEDEKSPDIDVSNLGELLKSIDDEAMNAWSPFGKPLNRTELQEGILQISAISFMI